MENERREPRPAEISTGKRLKEAREKKSLTIDQIQKQTKIHSTVLMALEEGRAREILTDTYIRSFLKKYAGLLGLPVNEILKEYFPPHSEVASSGISIHENPLPEETKIAPKVLYFAGLAILGILALLIVFIVGGKIVAVVNKARLNNQQKQPVAQSQVAKKKVSKPAKSNQKKKSKALQGSESKDIIPRPSQLILAIKVKEPVLVKLTKDGVLIFDRVMPKDLTETITANESIELKIGKAEALDLVLNGHSISLPARSNIFGLVITRKGVRLK